MKVDFIFDIASPNAYFCHQLIPGFEERTGVKFDYIPCLLGGIMKLSGNQPPFVAFADPSLQWSELYQRRRRRAEETNALWEDSLQALDL